MKNLLLKLIQKFYLKDYTKFRGGDLVQHINNEDLIYDVVGIFFTYYLKPQLFIQDSQGYIFGVPIHEYKRVSDIRKINAGY